MRIFKISILLLLICAFFACKKSSHPSPDNSLSATVDGLPWVSSGSYITISKSPGIQLSIGADSSATHIRLYIGNYIGKGKYIISDSGTTANYVNYYNGAGVVTHKATSGEIVVTGDTSVNNGPTYINGTFRFLGDTISVENGLFAVKLDLN